MKTFDVNNCTLQEACDYVVTRLVEQGDRCMKEDNCVYGDGNGNHCAVGWLLDHSDNDLMGRTVTIYGLVEFYRDKVPMIIKRNIEVFELLQSFHDSMQKHQRILILQRLKEHIDVSNPVYSKWVDLGYPRNI